MGRYDEEDFDDIDLDRDEDDEDDEETLGELFVTNDGHVVEGRKRAHRSREDEYEPDLEVTDPVDYDDE